jgi:AICAR transformylase/IMP cyclohydrolase PurH
MRAILAAWDKAGIVDLGRSLIDLGWEVMSSGRTLPYCRMRALRSWPAGTLAAMACK